MLVCNFQLPKRPGESQGRLVRMHIDKVEHKNFADRSVPFERRFQDSRIPVAINFAMSTDIDSVVILGNEIMPHTEYQRRLENGMVKHQ